MSFTLNRLHDEIKSGVYMSIKRLLERQLYNINCRDHTRKTPLIIAMTTNYKIKRNQLSIIRLLLSCSPNVNLVDVDGRNALMYACESKNLQAIRLLLKASLQDLDLTLQDKNKTTALMFAVETEDISIVKAVAYPMRRFHLKFDVENKMGMTAFDMAIDKELTKIILILHDVGCRPKTPKREKILNRVLDEEERRLDRLLNCSNSDSGIANFSTDILKTARNIETCPLSKATRRSCSATRVRSINKEKRSRSTMTYRELENHQRNSKIVVHQLFEIYTLQLCPSYKQPAKLTEPDHDSDFSDSDSCFSIQSFRSTRSGYARPKSGYNKPLINIESFKRTEPIPLPINGYRTRKAGITVTTMKGQDKNEPMQRIRKTSAPVMPNRSLLRLSAKSNRKNELLGLDDIVENR